MSSAGWNVPPPNLWDLVERALDEGVDIRTLHFVPGRPPMWRVAEVGLCPVEEEAAALDAAAIIGMLATVVEPERWDLFEQIGEGEVGLHTRGAGRPVRLVVYRSEGAWSAVVHL